MAATKLKRQRVSDTQKTLPNKTCFQTELPDSSSRTAPDNDEDSASHSYSPRSADEFVDEHFIQNVSGVLDAASPLRRSDSIRAKRLAAKVFERLEALISSSPEAQLLGTTKKHGRSGLLHSTKRRKRKPAPKPAPGLAGSSPNGCLLLLRWIRLPLLQDGSSDGACALRNEEMRSWVSSFIEYVADQLKQVVAAESSPLSVRRLVAFKGHRSAPCDANSSERIDMALAQGFRSLGSVENVEAPEYANTVALIEVRQCLSEQNCAYWQLAQRTHTLHSTQINRRFAWGLTVCGTHVRACLFGNDDILASKVMGVATESGRKQFVTLLVNWAMCESQRLGYDSTVRYNGETSQWEIDVWDDESRVTHTYIHERTLFDISSQFGRRTRCFIASAKENSGEQPAPKVLIKDAWAPTEFPDSEVVRDELSNLRTIRDKLGADNALAGTYSHLEAGGVVQQMQTKQKTADDTTGSIFADIDAAVLEDVPARIHRRVATTPVGEQLKSVRSVDELIVVVSDVMAAHTAIVRRCGILHRDLSTNNIMFCRDDDGMVRGLLIDFDNAVLQSDLHDEQRPDQIGTFPYMSIGNLEQSSVKRTALDDWESLIYILCWLGTIGINREDQNNVEIRSNLPICRWRNATDPFAHRVELSNVIVDDLLSVIQEHRDEALGRIKDA
ncbi:hypothetical protein IWW55_000395 [Coemansia sp. RSA 2706]|nr:hypothetical protein IWW55_000395 [Coemansia sp. RSA 2706]KAJ2313929.1 hypothetical protein IWW54_001219 [Coemansia sp. RSA 2705]